MKLLLVGDSALGNAVDAAAWSRALNEPVLSLPLTGLYGFGGSLNLIRRTLRTQPIRTVVIFQNAGIMSQKVWPEGILLTAERWGDLDLVSPPVLWSWLVNFSVSFNVFGGVITGQQDRTASFVAQDYAAQQKALPETGDEPQMAQLDPANINPGHMVFLARIGLLCEEKRIRCLYVHGPITDAVCKKSGSYVEEVNRRIRSAGLLPVARSPICMPWAETGDSPNHVRPSHKVRYSSGYFELIRPYLN